MPDLSLPLALTLAFLFVLINAFFVIAEYSIVMAKQSRIDELKDDDNPRSQLMYKILTEDKYVEAAQFGISTSSIFLGGIVGITFVQYLAAKVDIWDYTKLDTLLGFILVFILIIFFQIVFGELLPKTITLTKSEKIFNLFVRLFYFYTILFKPTLFVLDMITHSLSKIFGIKEVEYSDDTVDDDEIKSLIGVSQREGLIDKTESDIIKNAVDFSEKVAREVMIPRQDIEALYLENTTEENFDIVKKTRYTRYPVCDGDKDNVVGMIHLRDLVMYDGKKGLKSMMRDVLFVPENTSISELMHLMNNKRIHLAIVTDEYGGTSGLITMEDVLEELVGDIKDEHDVVEESYMKKIDDTTFEFLGMTLLGEAMEFMGLHPLEEHEEDTIGSYMFGLLAKKPLVGDAVTCPGCVFEIMETEDFRVKTVRATLCESEEENEESTEEESSEE